MTGTPSWRVHRIAGSLGKHAADWDALNRREFSNHPLLDSRFVNGLLAHFGTGRELLAIRTANGIDAMCLLEPRRLGVWHSFLPTQAQIGPTLIKSVEQLQGLLPALPGFALQVDLLCQDPRFSSLWRARGPYPATCLPHATTTSIALEGTFSRWFEGLNRSLKSNLRRYEKRANAGSEPLTFRRVDSPVEIPLAVARYAQLEGSGWKGAEGTALGSNPAQLGFYTDLMCRFAEQRQAHVYELWQGERLAAARLVIRQGVSIVMLKTTYDEALREWAPGRLLLNRVIEDAFGEWPGCTIEFYTNAAPEQLSWADAQRSIVHVSLRRSGPAGVVVRAAQGLRDIWTKRGTSPRATKSLEERADAVSLTNEIDPDLERLFATHERHHFQLGADWWRVYGSTVMAASEGTRLLVLRRGGWPVAVLPANVDPALRELGGMVGALANYYSTLYLPLVARDATGLDLLPLVRLLRQESHERKSLRFEPLDPDSPATQALEWALDAAGYSVTRYRCSGNWYLPVRQTWNEYFGQRQGELRSTVRRKATRLAAHGGRIEVIEDVALLPDALEAFAAVYRNSWKHQEPVAGFIEQLSATYAKRGQLRLGVVRIGEKPIAAQIWIVNSGRAYIYKLAHDRAYNHLAPGTLLTAHLMRWVIENDQVAEVDFMSGDEPFKRQWMSHRRERCGLVANDLHSIDGWLGAAREAVSRAWHRAIGREPNSPPAQEPIR